MSNIFDAQNFEVEVYSWRSAKITSTMGVSSEDCLFPTCTRGIDPV
jgi:hypothetical protein